MTDNEILQKLHERCLEMLKIVDGICKKYDITYYLAYGSLLGAVRHQGIIPWDDDIDIWITRDNLEKFCQHLDELPTDYALIMPEDYGPDKCFDVIPHFVYRKMYFQLNEDASHFYNDNHLWVGLDFFLLDRTTKGLGGVLQRFELSALYAFMGAYRHKMFFAHCSALRKIVNPFFLLMGRHIPLDWLRRRVIEVADRYNDRDDANYCFCSTISFKYLWLVMPEKCFGAPQHLKFENLLISAPQDPDIMLRMTYGDYMKLPPENERILHWGFDWMDPNTLVFEEPPK